jgi:hypothetical protein
MQMLSSGINNFCFDEQIWIHFRGRKLKTQSILIIMNVKILFTLPFQSCLLYADMSCDVFSSAEKINKTLTFISILNTKCGGPFLSPHRMVLSFSKGFNFI